MDRSIILNYKYDGPNTKRKVAKKAKKTKYEKPSRFHVVIVTNISGKQISEMSEEKKNSLLDRLELAKDKWLENIKKFMFCDNPNKALCSSDCKVVRETLKYEIGGGADAKTRNKSGILHLDGNIEFSGYCKFNIHKTRDWFKKALGSFVKGGIMFKAKYLPDNWLNAEEYSKKEQKEDNDEL